MFSNYFKTVSIFVGMFVGAGFGTGAEVMLFFHNSGYIGVVMSSILVGILAYIFAKSDKYIARNKFIDKVTSCAVLFCASINFIAMITACETITKEQFGITGIGLVISVLICFFAVRELNFIKVFNSLIVPVIVVFMIILASRTGVIFEYGAIDSNFALYATMNMVLGGHLMRSEGKAYTKRQLITVCSLISFTICILMSICYCISAQASEFVMPIYEMARREGLSGVAWLIILCAIVTTQISSGNVLANVTNKLFNRYFSVILLVLLALNCYNIQFSYIIATLYPITGWVGVAYTMLSLLIAVIGKLRMVIIDKKLKCPPKTIN